MYHTAPANVRMFFLKIPSNLFIVISVCTCAEKAKHMPSTCSTKILLLLVIICIILIGTIVTIRNFKHLRFVLIISEYNMLCLCYVKGYIKPTIITHRKITLLLAFSVFVRSCKKKNKTFYAWPFVYSYENVTFRVE